MKIHQILKVPVSHYNKTVWQTKLDWFKIYNPTNQELQIALLSQSLHNYFDKKFAELENHFVNQVLFFDAPTDKNQLIDLYIDITNDIFKTFPSALKPKISKKQKIQELSFN